MEESHMGDDEQAVDQVEELKSRAEDPQETAQSDDDPDKVDEIEAMKKREG